MAPKAYTDFQALLDTEELDAVSICTPPPTHRAITEQAAARGLHVLCEKPLAMNVAEGKAMVAAAPRANIHLLTAFCNRFYTPIVKAKEWIDTGKLGKLHHLRLRFAGVELMAGTWLADPAEGGGILWESGQHYVDLFRYLVGEMKEIYAKGSTPCPGHSGDRYIAFMAESVDGVVGTLEASWSSPHSKKCVEVYGERGAIVIDFSLRPQPLQLGPRHRAAGVGHRRPRPFLHGDQPLSRLRRRKDQAHRYGRGRCRGHAAD